MARLTNTLLLLTALTSANAYWLMGIENFITTERMDPIVNPGTVSGHVHAVLGGSNFALNTTTAKLRESECTSTPIPQDKSNYWFPELYFQWANGSFSSLDGGAVIYYLFSDKSGTTTAFPDDFRMISGTPTLRTYDATSYAQQAVTFLCLDFSGTTTRHNSIPTTACPSGIRAQINFPSCWDGKNTDSTDHKSHVAFPSGGPDSGTCSDPKYPVTIARIFMEVYWGSADWDQYRSQAMNKTQPFVYSYGDRTGYGYHADFINGWDKGVLQGAVDGCNCNPYGDPTCCAAKGLFDLTSGKNCRITKTFNEATTGTLPKLPGNNPVQEEGKTATMYSDPVIPAIFSPVYAYTGNTAPAGGVIATPVKTASGVVATAASSSAVSPSASSAAAPSASSSLAASHLPSSSAASSIAESTSAPHSASPSSPASGSGSNSGPGKQSSSAVSVSHSSAAVSAPATSPSPTGGVLVPVVISSSASSSSSVAKPAATAPTCGSKNSHHKAKKLNKMHNYHQSHSRSLRRSSRSLHDGLNRRFTPSDSEAY